MMNNRITRDEVFFKTALLFSERSTCPRKKVGAVLVKDKRIIATGYNGVLPGISEKFSLNEDGSSRTVHAEANIISFCAKHGISTDGAELFITLSPCEKCAELIVQAGITKVRYLEKYRCDKGILLLESLGISCLD
jgi:dCMP deaminase